MNRSQKGFTVVELLIVVTVIAILAAITIVGYNGIRVAAMKSAAQSDLRNVETAMQLAYQDLGTYPSEIPSTVKPSPNVALNVRWSGTVTSYGTLTDVQNGVLLSQICQNLIDEGAGKGVNNGGSTQTYIMGCGNWNHGSMQVTAWDSRVWSTPISDTQLLNYANTFTTSDTWNSAQIGVVKNFYTQLVQRHIATGGTFPIKSFWDSWATTGNGGVMKQPLPATLETKTTFCVEATTSSPSTTVWHIDENGSLKEGAC